jgi:CheY-like chemotaxis protein
MKILIVDDHALVRRGMNYVVKEGFPDAEVVEAESAAAALESLKKGAVPDMALVDVRMPDLDGPSCSARSRRNGPTCRSSCCRPTRTRRT